VKFVLPFTRSRICAGDRLASQAVSKVETMPLQALEPKGSEDAEASARASEELHFQMLCLAFVAMSG